MLSPALSIAVLLGMAVGAAALGVVVGSGARHPERMDNIIDGAPMLKLRLPGEARSAYFYRREVSVAQFERFCAVTSYSFDWAAHPSEWFRDKTWPMTHVTVRDAMAYARWARGRLPSTSEWRAAAGATGGRFPWGDAFPPAGRVGNIADRALSDAYPHLFSPISGQYADGFSCLAPVGSFPEVGSDLCDMSGNVSELCVDPPGERMVFAVGPSWASAKPAECELRMKRPLGPEERDERVGFRCVVPLR
jgi:formylglycine-generating enzyme required for sulfatase activity